jgi:macrolide transport system ATP-binding/permease protein
MIELGHDIRYALRAFRSAPGLFGAIVVTLGIAIGGNATVFSWIEGVVLRPMSGVPDQTEIVAIAGIRQPGDRCCVFSYPDYVDYRDGNPVFDGIVAGELIAPTLNADGKAERVIGQTVTGNYFDVLRVKPQLGRTFTEIDDRLPMAGPVAVISDGFWRRRFGGDPNVIGRTILLNRLPFTIIGVTPPPFIGTFVGYSLDLWTPTAMEQAFFPGGDHRSDRAHAWLEGYARLKPGVTREQAQAELDVISRRIQRQFPDTHRGFYLKTFALSKTPYGGLPLVSPVLGIAAVVVAAVFLIACANVAGLLLTRAIHRRQEMALRLSLGATRARLVRQILTESCVYATAGGIVGLLFPVYFRNLLPYFFPSSGVRITMDGQVDWRVLLVTFALTVVTGLSFGLWPAVRGLSSRTIGAIKDASPTTSDSSGGRVRSAFLVVQIALTVVLLVGASLFLQTLWRVGRADLGVDRDHVLLASFDLFQGGYNEARGRVFLQRLVADSRHLPGVVSASVAMRLPFSVRGPVTAPIEVPGYRHDPDDVPFAEYNLIGPEYARAVGLPLLRGRDISQADRQQSTPVAIVNQTMARRYWPNGDAVGQRFSILGKSVQIVGVARDGFYHSLTEGARPYVYLPIQQFYQPQATIVVRTVGDPAGIIQPLQSVAARLDPTLPLYSVMPMSAYLGFAVIGQRTATVLLGAFGTLALFLASLGLYNALAYAVATRRREIGIRMALGGRRIDVVALLLRGGTTVIIVGVGAGLIAATALARFVAAQVFGVTATDPLTYLTAALVVGATAFLATVIPAIRASRADVTAALRCQ